MFLDAGKEESRAIINEVNFRKPAKVYEKWKNWKVSEISHHGKFCCEVAREWLVTNDFSELNGESILTGPRWLNEKFDWGASEFPIYWCEALRRDVLDCGALAALAYELFTARGLETYRVQMVQRFSDVAVRQWASSWNDDADPEPLRWTDGDLIYHEGCAVMTENDELKIWDATSGWWVEPGLQTGYGAVSALRIKGKSGHIFKWGGTLITANKWIAAK